MYTGDDVPSYFTSIRGNCPAKAPFYKHHHHMNVGSGSLHPGGAATSTAACRSHGSTCIQRPTGTRWHLPSDPYRRKKCKSHRKNVALVHKNHPTLHIPLRKKPPSFQGATTNRTAAGLLRSAHETQDFVCGSGYWAVGSGTSIARVPITDHLRHCSTGNRFLSTPR